jgi:zinc transport system substrate-binding protein
MRRRISSAGIAALALATAATAARADAEVTAWRLFVSDHGESVVRVIDALSGQIIETFPTHGPAGLYRSESGETVYAVQGSANVVSAFGSGIAFEEHGDHQDIDVDPPKRLGIDIAGERPSHFVERRGQLAAFFDGEGVARIFSERAALQGSVEIREVDTGAPHHGVAIVYGEYDLLSVPHPEDPSNLPVGIRTVDRSGAQVGEPAECPDLHGEATSGSLLAFACATGLLVVESDGGAPSVRHVAYADTLPEGKSTTLVGGRGLQYFLGNFGPAAVVLIDPEEAEPFRLIELPTRRVTFAIDPIRARFAYVFTENGRLHRIDVISGEITDSLPLTGPYSMDGHWSDARPRVTVAGDSIFVTDPLESRILRIDAGTFAVAGEIAVEGMPFNIVAVGGTGEAHDDDDDDDDDDDGDHDDAHERHDDDDHDDHDHD